MTYQPDPQRGFTLIELMVTLAIAAILLLTAVPSMLTYKRNADLTSAANTLFAAINAARGEALKRGRYASVVPLGTGAGNGSNWATGWIVFIDINQNGVYDATVDTIVLKQAALPSYITVTGNGIASGTAPAIMYDASGYSIDKAGALGSAVTLQLSRNDVSSSAASEETRFIKIARTGRPRVCKPASSTDTTCNLSSTS